MIATARAAETLSLIRCGLGPETYGLDMRHVRAIQGADRLRPLVGPGGQVGTLPTREGDLPVFGLAELLQRDVFDVGQTPHVIVLHGDPQPWGLLVDRVSRVVRVPAAQVQPAPAVVQAPIQPILESVVEVEDELVLLLNPAQLRGPGGTAVVPAPSRAPAPKGRTAARRRGPGRIVLFTVADPAPDVRPLVFGISLMQMLEILEPLPLVPVPMAEPYVLGLARWRDQPVPVLDLALRFGQHPTLPDNRTRLLIVRAVPLRERVGFLVRPTIRMLSLPIPHEPCAVPDWLPQPLIRGCVSIAEEIVVIPDFPGVLNPSA
jgi:purine-binding chemotaxis protein CheW